MFKNKNITNKINDGTKLVAFDLLVDMREEKAKAIFVKISEKTWSITLCKGRLLVTEQFRLEIPKPPINTIISMGLHEIRANSQKRATEYSLLNATLSEYIREMETQGK